MSVTIWSGASYTRPRVYQSPSSGYIFYFAIDESGGAGAHILKMKASTDGGATFADLTGDGVADTINVLTGLGSGHSYDVKETATQIPLLLLVVNDGANVTQYTSADYGVTWT